MNGHIPPIRGLGSTTPTRVLPRPKVAPRPPLAERLRALLADWTEDANAHDVGLADSEPTDEQQRWVDEGYRRGVLCAVADLEPLVPRKRGGR